MTEPSLALQKAIRGRLIADAGVTALVPATSIFDRHARPETFPCVILGDAQLAWDPEPLDRDRVTVFADLHVWQREGGMAGAKSIVGAIKQALDGGWWVLDQHSVADLHVPTVRFLRDPSGEHSHAVVTVEATLKQVAI